ncbi:alpha/beta fold hydrolase [Nakamurella leprariae]|uniref:alpha/beta fold hydrolase n=1 Tax=Nakamurella leprariae TaxID=2803911 RepID=UPI002E288510|nr:alpha/beta fold hydrolase [Nakamurella leprariae]
MTRVRPASLPPAGLPGLERAWSRLVRVPGPDGDRTFHVLDSWHGRETEDERPTVTLLCVHGNPTWSYLWRRLLAAAPADWRVIAPDHLGMGFSERPDRARVLAERVDDLDRLTAALGVTGPVVTVAHDWGGIISMGWAHRHRDELAGLVLTNTAVHQPEHVPGPILIRLAHQKMVNRLTCRWTPTFVRATTALSRPALPRAVRSAFALPYRGVDARAAVAEFVADVPFAADHPSRPTLDEISGAMPRLDVPALLLWGPRDPVFGEVHLRDLLGRLPGADLHRYELASHLLAEDAPEYAAAVVDWVTDRVLTAAPTAGAPAPAGPVSTSAPDLAGVFDALDRRRADPSVAVVQLTDDPEQPRSISWAELAARVDRLAAGLRRAGVRDGDRVAMLVPPSIELTVALYAVWRAGGAVVVADKGLGLRGMGRALRGSRIDHLVADVAGLAAAGPMRVPGTRFAVRDLPTPVRRAVRVAHTFAELETADPATLPDRREVTDPDREAAVLFTSGATGPAKGVRYRHRQLGAQLALIRDGYRLTEDDRMVAAFAPFALYGPALGVPSAVPATDVTKPATLTAAALGDAAAAFGDRPATVVFASPAALRTVLATQSAVDSRQRQALASVRLLLSAGAPVPASTLHALRDLLPAAEAHTPYGMTESLPATDIDLAGIDRATEDRAALAGTDGSLDGVCVGRPLPGVEVAVAPLDPAGTPAADLVTDPDRVGELWIRARHIRDRYDGRWVVDHAAAAHPGWHRTGDVGRLDGDGRVWVQGRMVHVLTTPGGPVTPVGAEQRVQDAWAEGRLPGLDRWSPGSVAVVGVGPAGTQQVVVVVGTPGVRRSGVRADTETVDAVRALLADLPVPVAAVLRHPGLPVDVRHNSKIDRVAVAGWAARALAGG